MVVLKGSVQLVAPTYGLAEVPCPLPPTHETVGEENTSGSAPQPWFCATWLSPRF